MQKERKSRKYKYLVKVAMTKKALTRSCIPYEWTFWDKDYRVEKRGVALSCFDSKEDAQKAIDKERRLLKWEYKQYKSDIAVIKRNGIDKRYRGILSFMKNRLSRYAIGKLPVFKIVPINADKWESLLK